MIMTLMCMILILMCTHVYNHMYTVVTKALALDLSPFRATFRNRNKTPIHLRRIQHRVETEKNDSGQHKSMGRFQSKVADSEADKLLNQ